LFRFRPSAEDFDRENAVPGDIKKAKSPSIRVAGAFCRRHPLHVIIALHHDEPGDSLVAKFWAQCGGR
jgi:hypothetical protein